MTTIILVIIAMLLAAILFKLDYWLKLRHNLLAARESDHAKQVIKYIGELRHAIRVAQTYITHSGDKEGTLTYLENAINGKPQTTDHLSYREKF